MIEAVEEMVSWEQHASAIAALEMQRRDDLSRERMRTLLYLQALRDAGIEPPDADDNELLQLWQDARAVVSTASEFVHHLGTAKELLEQPGSQDMARFYRART